MGNSNMNKLPSLVQELKGSKEITEYQAAKICHDLKDETHLKSIQSVLEKNDLKDLLKLYIQAHYFDDEPSYETSVESKESARQKREESLKAKIKLFQKNAIIQEFTAFFENFKDKYKMAIRLLSETVCYQTGKTHSCITKLLDHLMNIITYGYFKFTPTPKPKIEYFDSAINYLTIYFEEEVRFKEIARVSQKIQEGIYDRSNKTLCELFHLKQEENALFFVEGVGEEKLIFRLRLQDNVFYEVLKSSPDMRRTFSMFVETIRETLHRSKFETSNVQYTVKSMIDVLDFSLKMNNIVGQKRILLKIESETKRKYESLEDYLNERKRGDPNSPETGFIEEMSEQFSESLGKFLLRINVYKTQLSDNSIIFMDFDRYGILNFISNRLPSAQYNRLRLKFSNNADTIRIQDIFKESSKIIKNFKTAFNGLVINQPLHFHQDGYPGEITFAYDGNNELIRTHIHIYLKETKRTEASFKNILSVKSIISSDSEKDVNKVIKESTGINNAARKRIIDIKETENPGVTKFGWLELFVKHEVIDKYRKTFDEEKEFFDTQTVSAELIDQNESLYSVSPQLMNRIDIDNAELDLLELDKELFVPFVEKVFRNVRYFSQSKFNPVQFQNFVFEIQRKYQKHNNSFHNFVHGMNVMHYCYLLSKLPKVASILSDLDIFTLVFSGLCHDVGHGGFNNSFEIATLSKKAVRWNDKSPLQNYHIAKAFKILLKPNNNFLETQKKQQFLHFRKLAIANVLATDIKEHFPIVTSFENKIKSPKGFENNPADIELLSTFLMHTSDFSGASKYFEVSQKWSRLCNKQFSNQYREEGILGIPQTPFMKDLDNEAVLSKGEAGFLKVIVRPLFKCLNDFMVDEPTMKRMLDNIDTTILVWEKIAQSTSNPSLVEKKAGEESKQQPQKHQGQKPKQ